MVKNLPVMRKNWVQYLGWNNLLEKRTTTHTNILAWRIPQTEEAGGLQSMGRRGSETTDRLSLSFTLSRIPRMLKVLVRKMFLPYF